MLDHFYGLPCAFEKWATRGAAVADAVLDGAVKMVGVTTAVGDNSSEKSDDEGEEKHAEKGHHKNGNATPETTQAATDETIEGNDADEDDRVDDECTEQLQEPINFHVNMYALAGLSDIPSLRGVACQRFKECFESSMLKPGFWDWTMWYVFNTTPVHVRDLREATMDLLFEDRETVFEGEGFTKKGSTLRVEITTSILQTLIRRTAVASGPLELGTRSRKHRYPRCRIHFMGNLIHSGFFKDPSCPNADCSFCCPATQWKKYIVD